jgi:signal peptidase I
LHRGIQLEDVILFSLPNRDEKIYLKRVVALSGQFLEVRNGSIYINDQLKKETDQKTWQLAKLQVPEGQVYVLNDNYSQMEDSRSFGAVPEKYVLGKLLLSFKF